MKSPRCCSNRVNDAFVMAGGLGGTLETGRALDHLYCGDDNRQLCSLTGD